MKSTSFTLGDLLFILAFVFGISFLLFNPTAPSPEQFTQLLEREGYEQIQLNGYSWFGCGESDYYRESFTAVKNGQVVEGVLCKGLTKGITIRYD